MPKRRKRRKRRTDPPSPKYRDLRVKGPPDEATRHLVKICHERFFDLHIVLQIARDPGPEKGYCANVVRVPPGDQSFADHFFRLNAPEILEELGLYDPAVLKRLGLPADWAERKPPEDPLHAAIRTHVKCCACEGSLEASQFLNFVALNYHAEWPNPIAGNVLTGEFGQAAAVVCDRCIAEDAEILFAVEWPRTGNDFSDFEVTYHPVTSLSKWGG